MKSDLDIAKNVEAKPIHLVAQRLGIKDTELEPYGHDMGKVSLSTYERLKDNVDGKLVLVSAITPTPFGEGKTTISIGLTDGLNRIGKSTIGCLREPSLGPVLGMKGGATGGGLAQIIPREKINLHFTGDLHAISTAHNFLSTAIDNHLHYGNPLNLDEKRIVWPRTMDMNDRAIRKVGTLYRDDNFIITAASEIMAIFSLASSLKNLRERIDNILIAYDKEGNEVHAKRLNITDAMVILLKEAIKPNLVQTLEHNPVFVHGGPFANIAHGCNSLMATRTALKLGEFVVTEAGFGADLGLEKFLDIKTEYLKKSPDVVVLVATIRALKFHGFESEEISSLEALKLGVQNIARHTNNIKKFGIPYVIAINHFKDDTKEEIEYLINWAKENNHLISFVDSFIEGSKGAIDLATKVVGLSNQEKSFKRLYDLKDDLFAKVNKIATSIYGASGVSYSKQAKEKLDILNEKYHDLPICIAKTPLSFSNDAKKRGSIYAFELSISDARVSRGAGFVVVLTKGIVTMPGLPEIPNAEKMFIDDDGNISGKL
ncbi:MAG: formate--tetrahydrofolate ligase [Acholeplasmataceae bacterium]|nr:formate--tetrahydrofolate ligase [Acholeplasmataceae bacterium]MDD4203589.1 formate--tetrahydrofolate ligase [Acholeplasmataceae bacterium]